MRTQVTLKRLDTLQQVAYRITDWRYLINDKLWGRDADNIKE